MNRWIRRIGIAVGALTALSIGGFGIAWWTATPDTGAVATGARLARMQASPQWSGDAFANRLPEVSGTLSEVLAKQFQHTQARQVPDSALPLLQRTAADFAAPPTSGLRVTWLGHSTLYVEQDGARVLVDPVWGPYPGPWTVTGPTRFYEMPLPWDELLKLPIDAILISHDHYDHLDTVTVAALKDRDLQWLVPLGIGAHLEHWGVPAERITELDWWESAQVGPLTATATPSRHFSGRWLDRFRTTLWVGWALKGPQHNVYYSGDTSLFPELADIGERLGPFDLTFIEAGAYDSTWTDVHLGPEQAVVAHRMVRGGVMVPVHWGLFDLGNHGWTEPIERVHAAAERFGIDVRSPRPGGSVELAPDPTAARWWPEEPVETLATDPVWSTSVDPVLDTWWGSR